MTETPTPTNSSNYLRSGALAGAVSAFAFAVIHAIFISDIWFSLPLMLVAGALCGLCIGWSYGLVTPTTSLSSWWRYNLLFVAALALLGVVSVLVLEPVTTAAAVSEADEPAHELIRQALPLTLVFTLAAALVISLRSGHKGRTWAGFGAVLLTCAVVVVLLGLNVSIMGLVAFPRGSLYLIAEMFGLILAIVGIFAAAFTGFERSSLWQIGGRDHRQVVRHQESSP
jgi:hypothetical protein